MKKYEITIFNFDVAFDEYFQELKEDFDIDLDELECSDFDVSIKKDKNDYKIYICEGCWSKEINERDDKKEIEEYMNSISDSWIGKIYKRLLKLKDFGCKILDVYYDFNGDYGSVKAKIECNKNIDRHDLD